MDYEYAAAGSESRQKDRNERQEEVGPFFPLLAAHLSL
jgi:hypothetical protein